ncbi:MAG: PilT/PilU family type 4a pilus ATPase [Candidatus Peribacteraceae bacterium]|nr:PilT/PilU family type 4a pilus ATPase [Candidatus Peribacteraceae bacterium]
MPATQPNAIFQKAAEMGASDVHIAVGVPVTFRVNDVLTPVTKGALTEADVKKIVRSVLGESAWKQFERDREIDVSHTVGNSVRLRVNCHFERGVPSLAARIIPNAIPTLEEVGLGDAFAPILELTEGLILFTGPAGVGKSTSMAAVIGEIRKRRSLNIVTLEDPIEFVFPREGEGVVRQRQCGEDFLTFAEALRRVLRQDPDVVMVGEMRDLETIAATLTLAETGHLVFGTLHTPNAMQTIDRIVDVFPPHQQAQVRSQLSLSLRAIVSQRLLPKEGGGLTALRELLINTAAVGHIIRENRTTELQTVLQTGTKDGMSTFEADAKRLRKEGVISADTLKLALELTAKVSKRA